MQLLGTLVGFILTLFVFSYLFGDNFLFRLAIHVFIGVSAGFVAVMVWYNVIWPQLVKPMIIGGQAERVALVVPLILSLLLLTKASSRLTGLGTLPVAILVGVGAATAVGGALMGTIFPQAEAMVNMFDLGAMSQSGRSIGEGLSTGVVIVIGALSTLVYFHFGTRFRQKSSAQRLPWMETIAWIGQGFIAITFGALFAGIYAAALSAWVERIDYLIRSVTSFIRP